jgi:hypothetical protein
MRHLALLITLLLFSTNSFAEPMSIDEFSEYLSGIKGSEENIQAMESLWQKYDQQNLQYVRAWQGAALAPEYNNSRCVLFYPFSGPDVIHPLTLFPNCEAYIMVGLEPAGNINSKLENINFTKLRNGLYSLFRRSFFVTKEMGSDFTSSGGLYLPMLALLKRMGNNIENAEKMVISEEGNFIKADQGNALHFKIKNPKLDFSQDIYYIRTSLITDSKNIIAYLKKNPKYLITYLKAAQYALFDPRFISIRTAIIENSDLLLQDDSGIPYRLFNNKNWNISFYGNYVGPYGESFQGYKQPDLQLAVKKQENKSINFRLGYGYSKAPSFIMKIVRLKKKDDAKASESKAVH